MPPWQNPDEPQHLEFVRTLSQQPSFDLSKRSDAAVQEEIFRSMAEHDWWRRIRRLQPEPIPKGFHEEPFFAAGDVVGGMVNAPPLYYVLAARWVQLLGARDLRQQYYWFRVLSAIFAVLTLCCMRRPPTDSSFRLDRPRWLLNGSRRPENWGRLSGLTAQDSDA